MTLPVACQASIPCRSRAIPSARSPASAAAQPHRIVPPACQNENPWSAAMARASSAHARAAGPSRRHWWTMAAKCSASAWLLGWTNSWLSRAASRPTASALSGYPSSHRATAPNARQATPGSWPNVKVSVWCVRGSYRATPRSICSTVAVGSPAAQRRHRQRLVGLEHERRVPELVGQHEQLVGHRRVPSAGPDRTLWNSHSPHRTGKSRGPSPARRHRLAGPLVGPPGRRGGEPLRHLELQAEVNLQRQLGRGLVRLGRAAGRPPAPAQVVDRLPVGVVPGRPVGREGEVPDRPARVTALLEVDGQLAGRLAGAGPVGRLQPLAEPLVQHPPAGRRHPLDHHPVVQLVPEPVPGRHRSVRPLGRPLRPEEVVSAGQGLAALLGPDHVRLGGRGRGRRGELDPGHARPLEHPQLVRLQAVELLLDQGPHARRDTAGQGGQVGRQLPPARPRGQHLVVEPVIDQADQEQRVPLGPLVQQAGQPGRRRRPAAGRPGTRRRPPPTAGRGAVRGRARGPGGPA